MATLKFILIPLVYILASLSSFSDTFSVNANRDNKSNANANGRGNSYRGLTDKDSFIVKSISRNLFEFAKGLLPDCSSALPYLQLSHQLVSSGCAAGNIANCYNALGNEPLYQVWIQRTAQADTGIEGVVEEIIKISRDKQYEGDVETAIYYMRMAIEREPNNVVALYLLAHMLQTMGDDYEAFQVYKKTVELSPKFIKARINLAAMYQTLNDLDQSIYHYKYLLDNVMDSSIHNIVPFAMTKANLAIAYYQKKKWGNAIKELDENLELLRSYIQSYCNQSGHYIITPNSVSKNSDKCNSMIEDFGIVTMHWITMMKSICNWNNLETAIYGTLLPMTIRNYVSNMPNKSSLSGPMLPFDSLLIQMSKRNRLMISELRAQVVSKATSRIRPKIKESSQKQNLINLGFLSYDFNDHPTAHLIEGLFDVVHEFRRLPTKQKFSYIEDSRLNIFNYGPDDSSEYRSLLQKYADNFVDLPIQSHSDSANIIASENIDILLDMQLYTLGGRPEILSFKPAPIIINYLVFPGTSGSLVHDYIIADRVVIPAEDSIFFSERLLLLPPSYQISTYRNIELLSPTRENSDVLTLVNFNKIDKLDMDSLTVWMQIMRRFPKSKFQLLDPSSSKTTIDQQSDQSILVRENVYKHFEFFGIHGTQLNSRNSRLEFVPRVSKREHIQRQFNADLFLDTVVYGAHSTATDSLRAGLPVLTVQGDSFPSRVAASLYESFDNDDFVGIYDEDANRSSAKCSWNSRVTLSDTLVTYSLKEMEDVAISLLKRNRVLAAIRKGLSSMVSESCGIFSVERGTIQFMRGMQAVFEHKNTEIFTERPHVVLC